jgi:hypothetical protein
VLISGKALRNCPVDELTDKNRKIQKLKALRKCYWTHLQEEFPEDFVSEAAGYQRDFIEIDNDFLIWAHPCQILKLISDGRSAETTPK